MFAGVGFPTGRALFRKAAYRVFLFWASVGRMESTKVGHMMPSSALFHHLSVLLNAFHSCLETNSIAFMRPAELTIWNTGPCDDTNFVVLDYWAIPIRSAMELDQSEATYVMPPRYLSVK